jgi:subtilase family serine protease
VCCSGGGTPLHLDPAGDRLLADNVCNDADLLGWPAAGSGGESDVFARPAYQDAVAGVVGDHRGIPDVSLSAAVDGGVEVDLSVAPVPAGFSTFGGTSAASPLFSVAVADQAAHHDLGLLNPSRYALAAQQAPGIVDITTGNNTVTFTQGGKDVTIPG